MDFHEKVSNYPRKKIYLIYSVKVDNRGWDQVTFTSLEKTHQNVATPKRKGGIYH